MNKNLIFSLLFLTSFNLVIKSAEPEEESKQKQEKKLTKYEKILAKFPGIGTDLISKGVSEEDINNSKGFNVCAEMIYFERGDQIISIRIDYENPTKYIIKIQKRARLVLL